MNKLEKNNALYGERGLNPLTSVAFFQIITLFQKFLFRERKNSFIMTIFADLR